MAGALTALSVAFVLLRWPTGPAGEWNEIYATEPAWLMVLWSVAPLAVAASILVWVSQERFDSDSSLRARKWAPLALAILCFWTLKTSVHLRQSGAASNHFYYTATIGPGAFTGQAMNLNDAGQYFRDFPDIASQHWGKLGGTRVISSPPGTTLLIYGCRRILEGFPGLLKFYVDEAPPPPHTSAETKRNYLLLGLSLFVPDIFILLTALGMLPLWWLANDLLPEREAVLAACLVLMLPSLWVFSYSKDSFQMSITLWFWWALLRAVRTACPGRGLLAGVLLALGLHFSLAFLVAAGVAAVVVIPGLASRRKEELAIPVSLLRLVGPIFSGLLGSFLLLSLVTGYDPLRMLVTAYRGHVQYQKDFGNSYSTWVWLNLAHLLLFLGGPAAALWLAGLRAQINALLKSAGKKKLDAYAFGVSGSLLALDLWGKNLGEVPRLWLFLMPALIVGGLRGMADHEQPARRVLIGLLLLQGVQAVVFTLCMDPLGASQRALDGLLFQGLK